MNLGREKKINITPQIYKNIGSKRKSPTHGMKQDIYLFNTYKVWFEGNKNIEQKRLRKHKYNF